MGVLGSCKAHLQKQNNHLLILSKGEQILKGTLKPWNQVPDGITKADLDEDDNFDFDTELDQILADIKHTIDCLYRLSSTIADPITHNQSVQVNKFVIPQSKLRCIEDISRMYNKIDEGLLGRLGAANSQRRAYFTHRKALYHDLKDSSKDHDNSLMGIDVTAVEYAAFRSAVITMATLLRDDHGNDSEAVQVPQGASPDVEPAQRNFERLSLVEGDTPESEDSRSLCNPPLCPFCWTYSRLHHHGWE